MVNTTLSPEVADAVGVYVPPTFTGDGFADVNEIVCALGATLTDCCTCGAEGEPAVPAWLALIVQVPAASKLTTAPLSEHTPALAASMLIATASPDVAVAVGEYVPPTFTGDGFADVNEIVCPRFNTTFTDCCTRLAGLYVALPAWLALMMQSPTALKVTTAPAREQTLLLAASMLIATASPEVAAAVGVYAPPTFTGDGFADV